MCQRLQSTFGYCTRRKLEYSSSSELGSEEMNFVEEKISFVKGIFASQRVQLLVDRYIALSCSANY